MTGARKMETLLIGLVCGVALTLLSANFLFGAKGRMWSSPDVFNPTAYYVVGERRFDWFGKSKQNCWGGHTLDGRCISAVFISRYITPASADTHPEGGDAQQGSVHG